MTQIKLMFLALAWLVLLIVPAAQAAEESPAAPATLVEAVSGGKAGLEFRYRLEHVDQDPFVDEALASTLRTRLNYRTAVWRGWQVFLEADNVLVIGDDTYDSTRNGVVDRPVVADPEYTEFNQAYLQFRNDSFAALAGRQRIALDNQRFIGNVGWRQNEQTYDAITVRSNGSSVIGWQYSYLDNVNRVNGPDSGSPPGDYRSNSHALNLGYDAGGFGKLVGFAYLLDLENAAGLSSQTYGLLWTGNLALGESSRLEWAASWASQADYGDNPTDFDTDYLLAEGVYTAGPASITVGYEALGGDATLPDRAFQTPLASLHGFQGWADKFLTTPTRGVADFYAGVGGNVGPVTLKLVWHDFGAEAAGDDYGSEWDASAVWKFAKRYEATLKFADYDAEDFATDTTKTWLQFSAVF